jgi:predicted nucleotidyltransferase
MDNKAAILATLAYFDLFQYPLTEREIFFFLPRQVAPASFERALGDLLGEGLVYTWEGFYSVRNDAGLVHRRKAGNTLAARMLGTAEKIATLLSYFPYVRGVGVSGSLSKQYADEGSDIDLFIITSADRLWVARTLLHCIKKFAFLVRREDWFCMNYFVDEAALEIPEKNLYTAVEIVTLIPMRGAAAFSEFRKANAWTDRWLPHSYGRVVFPEENRPSFFKRGLEAMLNNALGDRLDRWLMKVTARRWQKKTESGKRNNRGVLMTMDATPHAARPEPTGFQVGLLEAYDRRFTGLLHKYEGLHPEVKAR